MNILPLLHLTGNSVALRVSVHLTSIKYTFKYFWTLLVFHLLQKNYLGRNPIYRFL